MIKKIGNFTQYAADITTLPTLNIVLGFFIVAVAIFGSYGVFVENKICLTIYAGTTFVVFVLQLAMISWVFVNISTFPNSKSYLVLTAWRHNTPEYGYPMDILQIQFDCCGRYGAKDYINANMTVPNSCCGQWILINCPDKVFLTKPGCYFEFYNFCTANNDIIRFVGIVLAFAQLVALFFTFHFVRALRQTS